MHAKRHMRTKKLLAMMDTMPEDIRRKVYYLYIAGIKGALHRELLSHVKRRPAYQMGPWVPPHRRKRCDFSGELFSYKIPCRYDQLFPDNRMRTRAFNDSNMLWGPIMVRPRRQNEDTELYWSRMQWFTFTDPKKKNKVCLVAVEERQITLMVPSELQRKCGRWLDYSEIPAWSNNRSGGPFHS